MERRNRHRIALPASILLASAVSLTAFIRFGQPLFLDASEGTAVSFTHLPLPPVAYDPPGEGPAPPAISPFAPAFIQLVSGETVMTTEQQMRHVWRRLFAVPYPSNLVDFDQSFVVLMGGGALAEPFFEITSVEQVEGEFAAVTPFKSNSFEPALAITALTIYPGRSSQEKDASHVES